MITEDKQTSGETGRHRLMLRFRKGLPLLLVLLIWLAIWQIAYWWIGRDLLLASPGQVLQSLFRQSVQADFWKAILYSLLRIQAGFILGLTTGSFLAVLTVRIAWLNRFFHPAISAIRSTPVASFIILALVWMSHNRVVIFIVFLMVMPIVWANVAEGITKTDRQLLEMGRVFRLSSWAVIRFIYLPSIAPFFMTAATTSLGLGWKAGVAAEVLSRPPWSLGGRLYDAKIYLETADLLGYTAIIIAISLLLEHLLMFTFHSAGRYFKVHGMSGRKAGPDS